MKKTLIIFAILFFFIYLLNHSSEKTTPEDSAPQVSAVPEGKIVSDNLKPDSEKISVMTPENMGLSQDLIDVAVSVGDTKQLEAEYERINKLPDGFYDNMPKSIKESFENKRKMQRENFVYVGLNNRKIVRTNLRDASEMREHLKDGSKSLIAKFEECLIKIRDSEKYMYLNKTQLCQADAYGQLQSDTNQSTAALNNDSMNSNIQTNSESNQVSKSNDETISESEVKETTSK